jgi:hypothetical protein
MTSRSCSGVSGPGVQWQARQSRDSLGVQAAAAWLGGRAAAMAAQPGHPGLECLHRPWRDTGGCSSSSCAPRPRGSGRERQVMQMLLEAQHDGLASRGVPSVRVRAEPLGTKSRRIRRMAAQERGLAPGVSDATFNRASHLASAPEQPSANSARALLPGYAALMTRMLFLLLITFAPVAVAQPAREWAAASTPTAGPARSIGGTALGCIRAPQALPPEGPAGKPFACRATATGAIRHAAFLTRLRSQARAAGLPDLLVGTSDSRGGPLPFRPRPVPETASTSTSGSMSARAARCRAKRGSISTCRRWCWRTSRPWTRNASPRRICA